MKIAAWNADGIKNKKQELELFLKEKEIDVALLNETHLSGKDSLKFQHFYCFRKDRENRQGGGVAILIRKNIQHHPLNNTAANENVEQTGIVVSTKSGKLALFAVYSPPGAPIDEEELDEIFKRREPTIAMGDFNAKHIVWNSKITNTQGRKLLRYVENRTLTVISTDEPTRYPPGNCGQPDILDIGIIKDINKRFKLEVEDELSSDHNPIVLTLDGSRKREPRIIEKVNWNKYEENFTIEEIDINNGEELEEATKKLEGAIQSAMEKSKTSKIQYEIPEKVRDEIKEIVKKKRKAKKVFQRTLAPQDKSELNRWNHELSRILREEENRKWERKMEELNEEDHPPWRMARALRKKREEIPPLETETGTAYEDREKAEVFAEKMEEQFTNNPSQDRNFEMETDQNVQHHLQVPEGYRMDEATEEEIERIIKDLNPKKAPGKDGITNTAIQKLPQVGKQALLKITNAILGLRKFPEAWKEARIIMIHKPGKKKKDPASYRPISLLSSLSKVAERVIQRRILEVIEERKIIPEEQHGFRRRHGTIHQTTRITDFIIQGFNVSKVTTGVFLDIEKAFDRVWHQGLVRKLIDFRIPLAYGKLIHSYLTNRCFQVKVNEEESTKKWSKAGVPQGSVLGPLLYLLYTADVPTTDDTVIATFADDTAILAQGRHTAGLAKKINTHLEEIEKWTEKWKIKVNGKKSNGIIFTKRPKKHKPIRSIKFSEEDIPWKTEVKYLGITMDQKLDFQKHINEAEIKAKRINQELYPLLNRRSKVSIENKIRIYTSVIRPTMTYGAPTWNQADERRKKKLQIVQNRTLRNAIDAPWFMTNEQIHNDLKIPPIEDVIQKIARRHFEKAAEHDNPTIRKQTEETTTRRFKRPRLAMEEE